MTSSRRRRQLRARRDAYFRQQTIDAIQALREPFVDVGLPPDQSTPLTIGGREVGRVSNLRTVDGDLIGDVTIPTDGWALVGDSRPEFAPDARIDILTRYGEWQYGRTAVDGTHEGLFALPDGMKTFVGRCRSTGRVYFLEVPPEIENCLQAQTWMLGGRVGNCVGAS